MTTVSVLASPPAESDIVDRLAAPPLDRGEAIRLYEAVFADVCRAIERSGADLVVAVAGTDDAGDPTRELDGILEESLETPEAVEVDRRENTDRAKLLASEVIRLHEEGVTSAAAMEPSAPFLGRTNVDSASMKLRSSEVVLGPAPDGRVYFAGFAEPMDIADRFDPTPIEGLAELAREGHAVDFLPMLPIVEQSTDLATAVTHLRARVAAGRRVPEATATVVADLGLAVREDEGDLTLVREESP